MWKYRLVKFVHMGSTMVNATRFANLRSFARLEPKCKRLMWRCITFGRPFLVHEVQLIDEASRSLRPVVGDALLVKEGSPAWHANLYCWRR